MWRVGIVCVGIVWVGASGCGLLLDPEVPFDPATPGSDAGTPSDAAPPRLDGASMDANVSDSGSPVDAQPPADASAPDSSVPRDAGRVRTTLFLTSASFRAGQDGFVGLSGADGLCSSIARASGFVPSGAVIVAVLSDSTTHAKDRASSTGPIFNTRSQMLAMSWRDLWDSSEGAVGVAAPIYDENANTAANVAWTATTSAGSMDTMGSANFCNDWSIPFPMGYSTMLGNPVAPGPGWIAAGTVGCGGPPNGLYCLVVP